MKKRIAAGLLVLLMLLTLCACGQKEMTEEERQQAIAEMGERSREFHAKRAAFLASNLYAEGMRYLTDTLEELVPGGEYTITLEPASLIDATEEELAASLDTEEARLAFFSRVELHFMVNFWDFDMDPHALCDALMARQISGVMYADEYAAAEWILNAETGEWAYQAIPGV